MGYNPITRERFIVPSIEKSSDEVLTQVDEHSLFIPALRFALSKSSVVKESIGDIRSALNYMEWQLVLWDS